MPGSVIVAARAEAAADGYVGNNLAVLELDIDNAVDLGLMMGSGGSGVEGDDVIGQVSLRSNGREAAANGTVDVELHAAGVLRAVTLHDGADCELLSPQRARCVLPPVASGSNLFIDYRARFETPGAYDIKYTLSVPGDTAPGNDSLARPIVIRPHYDIAVDGQKLQNWRQFTEPDLVPQGPNYYQYWYMPYGPLTAGQHVITYHITWKAAISDGYEQFGPGTTNPEQTGTCTFTVK